MKTCSVCKGRIDEDEGELSDDGRFVCFECSGEVTEDAGAFCKGCGELMEDGVCPICGSTLDDEEEEEDSNQDTVKEKLKDKIKERVKESKEPARRKGRSAR